MRDLGVCNKYHIGDERCSLWWYRNRVFYWNIYWRRAPLSWTASPWYNPGLLCLCHWRLNWWQEEGTTRWRTARKECKGMVMVWPCELYGFSGWKGELQQFYKSSVYRSRGYSCMRGKSRVIFYNRASNLYCNLVTQFKHWNYTVTHAVYHKV